jgi:hypothetical protein
MQVNKSEYKITKPSYATSADGLKKISVMVMIHWAH